MAKPKILLIGAMETELRDLLSFFQCKETDRLQNYYPFWLTNRRLNYKLGVLQTFVGDTNAGIATTLALKSFNPDYVFKVGRVGGNSHGIHTGDLLLPLGFFHSGSWITRSNIDNTPTSDSSLWQSVFGEKPYQVNSDNLGSHPYYIKPDVKLVEKFSEFCVEEKVSLVPCYIGGGNMWFFDLEFMKNVSKTHIPGDKEDQPWVGDMESYAIAQTCSVYDIPFMGFYKVSNSDYYNEPYIPEQVTKLFDLPFIEKVDMFLKSLVK